MTNTKKILSKKISEPAPPAVENTFAFRLAYALASRKISQAELAKMCGIAPSNISTYITKNAEPRMEKIRLIAEKLHVSEAWLTGNGKPSDIDRREGSDALSPDELKLVRCYQSLPSEKRDFILALIEAYKTVTMK